MIGPVEALMVLGTSAPALAFWVAVVIFAGLRIKGGGRAEKFLLAGGIIKLSGSLLSLSSVFIVPWLVGMGQEIIQVNYSLAIYNISLKIVSTAGIICLIYAFWVKFSNRNTGAAAITTPEH